MTSDDFRRWRRRRYLSLGLGEFSAAGVFIVVACVVNPLRLSSAGSLALWSALVPLVVILVQAGSYWLLARMWVGRSLMPRTVAAVFRVCRLVDLLLLGAGLVGVVVWWSGSGASLLAVAVWVFAAIEFVNYFVVRLAYPVTNWFTRVGECRSPQLVMDVQATAAASDR